MAATYNNLYLDARKRLREAGVEGAQLEARELVCCAAGKSREQFYRDMALYASDPVEEKLAELILQMKAEIASLRSGTSMEYPDGVSPKKKAIAAYLRENPGVNNKSYLARQLGMAITTVQKYYDEVRAELRGEESPAPQT